MKLACGWIITSRVLYGNYCLSTPYNQFWFNDFGLSVLTHWGRVTHIWVSKLTNVDSDNGLSPGRQQAIIWTNAGILLIGPLGTNFSEIVIGKSSFKKMHFKVSSERCRPFCLGLNVSIKEAPSTCFVSLYVIHRWGDPYLDCANCPIGFTKVIQTDSRYGTNTRLVIFCASLRLSNGRFFPFRS